MVNAVRHARAVLFAALVVIIPSIASAMTSGDYFVREVIDGDTIVLDNGETVRYVGLDTPEINEPYYLEAKVRNAVMVQARIVSVLVCGPEPRDRYGRVLAWVTSGGTRVNETLVKEGYARIMTIPPCGLLRANEFKALEKEARDKRLGIWGIAAQKRMSREISPYEAHMHIGERVRLRGTVHSIMPWGRSWFLEFRSPNGFRAVIIPKASDEFDMRGLNILDFRDKEVEITGVITENNGVPEILIDSPSRIQ
jgi:micrococcal nuclease